MELVGAVGRSRPAIGYIMRARAKGGMSMNGEVRSGRLVPSRPVRSAGVRRPPSGARLATGSFRFARGFPPAPISALALGGLLCAAIPAEAAEFGSGELRGSFDTTLSHGVTIRTGQRDDALTGLNSDDGGPQLRPGYRQQYLQGDRRAGDRLRQLRRLCPRQRIHRLREREGPARPPPTDRSGEGSGRQGTSKCSTST